MRERGTTLLEVMAYLFLFALLAGLMVRAEIMARGTSTAEKGILRANEIAARFMSWFQADVRASTAASVEADGTVLKLERQAEQGSSLPVVYAPASGPSGSDPSVYVRSRAELNELLGEHIESMRFAVRTVGASTLVSVEMRLEIPTDDLPVRRSFQMEVGSRLLGVLPATPPKEGGF